MERFASIKPAGKRRKLNVNTICRCCGLESDDLSFVLSQNSDDGVEFSEKIKILLGIHVTRGDKMPQLMCGVCIDKVNDFFEFRSMAEHTEKQTREALGLPAATPTPAPVVLEPQVRLVDLKHQLATIPQLLSQANSLPSTSKKRNSATEAATPAPDPKKSKKNVSCIICSDKEFVYQSDLNDHYIYGHRPTIAKYSCGSCRETFELLSENKAHETWHSRRKEPYTCYICSATFTKHRLFDKHMTNLNCSEKEKLPRTVEDIKCFQCKKKFLTQNLFEWHGCFIKSKGNCLKCFKYFSMKKSLFKHYIQCDDGLFTPPASALDPIKLENSDSKAIVKVSGEGKGPKKKIVPNRKMSTIPNIIKTELHLSDHAEDDDNYSNYEEDITYDNFGNDSDSNDGPPPIEPLVELREKQIVKIKQEKLGDQLAVQQSKVPGIDYSQLVRNIKKEKGVHTTVVSQQVNNTLKLKIKAERGSKELKFLNPMAIGSKRPQSNANQMFKLPQELRMKIKQEKKDAGYGDTVGARDEAEPEDEDLLGDSTESIVKIKQEKFDPAYGDSRDSTATKLINPMAMALMRREKSISNGVSEKSLVISAVTSINPDSPGTTNDADDAMTQSVAKNAQETPKTNDETSRKEDKPSAMVQIPSAFLENHSSHVGVCDEPPRAESNVETNTATANDDDLDMLLQKYESQTPADNGDIFQELLKSD